MMLLQFEPNEGQHAHTHIAHKEGNEDISGPGGGVVNVVPHHLPVGRDDGWGGMAPQATVLITALPSREPLSGSQPVSEPLA